MTCVSFFLPDLALSAAESGMTEWEKQREEEEFSRLAKVFQPLTASLTSRFTRGEERQLQQGSEGKREEPKKPERPLVRSIGSLVWVSGFQ